MKKKNLCLTSISALILLCACFPNNEEEVYYYDMLPEDRCIDYYDLFNQEEDFYMVYCFNRGCGACNSFKSYIIPYYDSHPDVPLYYADLSLLGDEIYGSVATELTLGMTSMDNFFIYGTPTLVGLESHAVCFNVCGTNAIKDILECF